MLTFETTISLMDAQYTIVFALWSLVADSGPSLVCLLINMLTMGPRPTDVVHTLIFRAVCQHEPDVDNMCREISGGCYSGP